MTESTPLPLLLLTAQRQIETALLARLVPLCPGLQPAHLALFAALDCGATHAADAAQRLGISRQAVARTARELAALGLVTLEAPDSQRNRNRIHLTGLGETLALEGRAVLARFESAVEAAALRTALATLAKV